MKIGLHMIAAGSSASVITCIGGQIGLMDCGVILVDSGASSDELYSQLVSLAMPNLIIKRHLWQDSFAQARNESLQLLLELFPGMDYIYWVDGDDIWKETTNFIELRARLEKERPQAVNLLYQYSDTTKFYRNRIWKVTDDQVPYYWRGGAHEVEWSKTDVWPEVVNWDDFILIHTRKQEIMPDRPKRTRNIKILQKAIQEDPEFSRNFYYLGQELFHNAEYEAATTPLQQCVDISSNIAEKYQALLILAQCFFNLKKISSSYSTLDDAIALYPDSQFAYTLKGTYLISEEKWKEAVAYLTKAISVPGAPVIFDYEDQRTVVPLRWLSVCYNKIGKYDLACRYHYLANICKLDDGLRRQNSLWLSSNKYLELMEPEHFLKTDPKYEIDLHQYMLFESFKKDSVKQSLLGAMSYNAALKIVRLINEGTDYEIAIVYKGSPNYEEIISEEEKLKLKEINYIELFRSHQFSLYEDFYKYWISVASKRSNNYPLSVVELGTGIGISARLIIEQVEKYRGKGYYDFTMVDTNLTKEAWAIIDEENVFFIHRRAEDAARFFKNNSIDILHMDLAPHSYEQAVEIFKLYEPKLTKEGIMIWHDVGESRRFAFGGKRFLNELRYPWCVSFCPEKEEMSDEAPAVVWREF